MIFKDTSRTTNITAATPERVYMLCKVVERENSIRKEELKEKVEPSYGKQQNYFTPILNAAIELELVFDNDGNISLAVERESIKTIADMRRYINSNIYKLRNGSFYQITSLYYDLDQTVFSRITNVQSLADIVSSEKPFAVGADEIRAWRFWASFLGFGYLDEMMILPNANTFIKDLINSSDIQKKALYPVDSFIEKISPNIDIILGKGKANHTLNYGLSCALYTLSDLKIITTERIGDFGVWNLQRIHTTGNIITHITVLR